MASGHHLISMRLIPGSPLLTPTSILLALPKQLPLPLAKMGEKGLTSDTGEAPSMSDPTVDPITEIFYDVLDPPNESAPDNDIFHPHPPTHQTQMGYSTLTPLTLTMVLNSWDVLST